MREVENNLEEKEKRLEIMVTIFWDHGSACWLGYLDGFHSRGKPERKFHIEQQLCFRRNRGIQYGIATSHPRHDDMERNPGLSA